MKTGSDAGNPPITRPERGMALVVVLWIVTLLAVMAGGFAYSMRIETRLATSAVERAQARAWIEAGVAYALAWQMDPEAQQRWPPNGDPREWSFGGGRLRIEIADAGGLVNLNTADSGLLVALLAAAGVDPQDRERLADAIQEWRGQYRDHTLPSDTESAEYRAAGRPGPKNAPFESVEELGQVLGMTQEIYERIAGVTTAFSHHAGINPELAPPRLLGALGLDEQRVADYLDARATAVAAGEGAPPPPSGPDEGQSFFFQSRARIYHIVVTAETPSGAVATAEAVVDGQGAAVGQGIRWLAWRW
jgi:general secretion pathway protein K